MNSYNKKMLLLISLLVSFGCGIRPNNSEAEKLAARIHSQIQARDYKALYENAGPAIHKVATEIEFVTMMDRLHSDYGALEEAVLDDFVIRMDSRLGKMYILAYNVKFERKNIAERIVFTAYDKGSMQLYELGFNPID